MIFHQISTERGCQSYLIGCKETCAAIIIDPEVSQVERYLALAIQDGLIIHYLLDTHTHADHFSASQSLARKIDVPIIMHRNSGAPFVDMRVDDGEIIIVGELRLRVMYTPGHTDDSICIILPDRVLTGDTLLIGATGRTDLPTGNPDQLYDSLFNGLLKLNPTLKVYPGHDYKHRGHSTLERELAENPRLQKKNRREFIELMQTLNLSMPTHLTEALRTNLSGGKTVEQLISEAAAKVSFMAMDEVQKRIQSSDPDILLLDVREHDAFEQEHIPGAMFIPRGQLELRVNNLLTDPTQRIVVYCEFGKISTLAAATLREMGFSRAVALDGGLRTWREAGYFLESGNKN
ncbi:MAG: MBL fold metallo-hydrolase [Gammaproteobacteria bacterium]|nr:MBL fold metallo-hydrolase [Gammaproteobacteria bacterium]